MKFSTKAIREFLKELNELIEKLKKAEVQKDKLDKILAEIKELDEILQSGDEDELKAFKMMRMLIEKLKDLGDKVPLLGTFIELYIAALKSTEWFIDNILKKYSFTGKYCDDYCKVRKEIEEKLIQEGESAEDAYEDSHRKAMDVLGDFPFGKYEDDFKKQYVNRKKKEWIQEEIEDVKKVKKDQEDKENNEEDAKEKAEREAILKTIDSMLALLQIIKRLEDKLKEKDLDPEERKKIKERLDWLWKVFQDIVSAK